MTGVTGVTAAEAASKAGADVSIVPESAEVWAWEADVHGELGSPVSSCRVQSGDREVLARIQGAEWWARVPLAPAENSVRATCVDARGVRHFSKAARLRAMLRDAPTARVVVSRFPETIALDATSSAPSPASRTPIVLYAWSLAVGASSRIESDGPHARVTVSPADPSVVVRLEVRDEHGVTDVARVRVAGHVSARDVVVYGVVPPLFGSPPLRAVTRALPDLAELGVDALWLSPIFETPPRDYGYAVTDYFHVRPDYGTSDDLAQLEAEAHHYGLRVVLDFVPNHTSAEHPYFRDATALGRKSHYWGFYARDALGQPLHYFDWTHLPNLEYRNSEVPSWILEAADRWMRRGADGYRLDVAWGIEERSPEFWDAFRDEMRRIDPDALLIAEATARDPFWAAHGFDAAYDWTDRQGHWSWEDVFREPDAIPDRLDAAVRATKSNPFRFLENNDTGPRFVSRYGPDMTRVAAAALLTLPGTPSLFTGQERGASYDPYERREPLDTTDVHGLRPWYRSLLATRRAVPALRGAGYARAIVDVGDARVLAYVREDEARHDVALVVLRFDARRGRARITVPEAAASRRKWRDAFAPGVGSALGVSAPPAGVAPAGAKRPVVLDAKDGTLDFELAPWAARVLVPAD